MRMIMKQVKKEKKKEGEGEGQKGQSLMSSKSMWNTPRRTIFN